MVCVGCAGGASGAAEPANEADSLVLAGHLSAQLAYRIRVDFATTLNDGACKFDDSITGMWVPLVESYYYQPTVSGDEHHLRIPLERPGPPDRCNWKPTTAYLCVGPRDSREPDSTCTPLLVARAAGHPPARSVAILCDPAKWVCVTAQRRDPVQEVDDLHQSLDLDISVGAI
jgi:hypothetical protein